MRTAADLVRARADPVTAAAPPLTVGPWEPETYPAWKTMAGYVRHMDRDAVRSYLGVPGPVRLSITDEPRPGPFSRLLCHYGMHRWVTMTTGRAGFVHFQRCNRRCGSARILKGLG